MKTIYILLVSFITLGMTVNATDAQTINVCTSQNPPFFSQNLNGELTGLEYDILSSFAVAQDFVLEVTFKHNFLAAGRVDAVACDSWLAASLTTARTPYGPTLALTEMSGFGFALPKGSNLTEQLNAHLSSLTASGAYKRLLNKHFGEDSAEMVSQAMGISETSNVLP